MIRGVFFFSALCGARAADELLTAFANAVSNPLANSVGYANTDKIETGYMMKTILFDGIGEEGLDIQSIKPIGDKVAGGGKIVLQVYDKDRVNTENYSWNTMFDDDEDQDGWYRGGYANKKIMPGTGVFVKAPYDLQLQMSGQVKTSKTTFVAPEAGYYIVGNSTPVEIDIQKILPKGDAVKGGGKIVLQVYDKDRNNTENYSWNTMFDDDEDADGWYRGGYSTRKLQPGEAVFLKAPYALTLEFPALELAK